MRRRMGIAVAMLLLPAVALAGQEGRQIRGPGDTEVVLRQGHATLAKAQVETTVCTQNCGGHGWWGVGDDEVRELSIESITINDGDSQVYVPRSAFGDLANPARITLGIEDGVLMLAIRGGDASSSYRAVLSIEDGELTRRTVRSGEFPDDVWEETTYSWNHSGD